MIFEQLNKNFNILKTEFTSEYVKRIFVEKNEVKNILKYIKNSSDYGFNQLLCITAEDTYQDFIISYIIQSTESGQQFIVSANIQKKECYIESVCNIFQSANFDEREIYDLFGIYFENHPNLKRILLPKNWHGHPLKKDYKMLDERFWWNFEQ